MELATVTNKNPYFLALQSKKIMELPRAEAQQEMCNLISKTYFEAGQAIPGGEARAQAKHLQLISGALYEEVRLSFPFLRADELTIAFRAGVREEYGQNFGINIISFHKWIKGYTGDIKRKEAQQALNSAKDTQTPTRPVMSATQAEYEWKRATERAFEKYKQTGHLDILFPSFVHNEFVRFGLMEESVEPYMVKGAEQVGREKRAVMLNPRRMSDKREASAYLTRAKEGKQSEEDRAAIKAAAHREAVKLFFDSVEKLEL